MQKSDDISNEPGSIIIGEDLDGFSFECLGDAPLTDDDPLTDDCDPITDESLDSFRDALGGQFNPVTGRLID